MLVSFILQSHHPQLSLELLGTHTDFSGMFFHRKLLMLTTALQHRQLLPAVDSNLPHSGSHCTSQDNHVQHHWWAASAGAPWQWQLFSTDYMDQGSFDQSHSSTSTEKYSGTIKGQNKKENFSSEHSTWEEKSLKCPTWLPWRNKGPWWCLAGWRAFADGPTEGLNLLLTSSWFNPFAFF